MPRPEIIVVGASAGGLEALQTLAAGFPQDFSAAVCVVLHIGDGINGHSVLPEILAIGVMQRHVNSRIDTAIGVGFLVLITVAAVAAIPLMIVTNSGQPQ